MHGKRDQIVPYHMGETLYGLRNRSMPYSQFVGSPEAGHNDLMKHEGPREVSGNGVVWNVATD